MYRIQFCVGMPYAEPRQTIAEFISEQVCPFSALAEASPKADFIATLLATSYPGFTRANLELVVTPHSPQIDLGLEFKPKRRASVPKPVPTFPPSGDYRASIEMEILGQTVQLGTTEYANTTAVTALDQAVETGRTLVNSLRMDPKLRQVINAKNLQVHVSRVNQQVAFIPTAEQLDPRDWQQLSYPQPRGL